MTSIRHKIPFVTGLSSGGGALILRALQAAETSGIEALALVNDLLDLAKIEAGKIDVKPRDCRAESIFSELRGMLKPLLANKAIELVFEPPEDIPPLFTDDEEVSRHILKSHLAGTRYIILEAADGAAGLRLTEAEQPSVIFLDLIMPGMSGFEVLQRLKANPATRAIPVIISASKALDEAERRFLNPQTLVVLSKAAPIREDAMAAVREALCRATELHEQREEVRL